MKYYSFLFSVLLLLISTSISKAQKLDSVKTTKLLVKCIDIKETGKRRQSYLFSFKIEKVLEGSFTGSFWGDEFVDIHANSIIRKISSKPNKTDKKVIIKLRENEYGFSKYRLLWMSEPERTEVYENLEKVAFTLLDAIEHYDYDKIAPYIKEIDIDNSEDISFYTRHNLNQKKFNDISAYSHKVGIDGLFRTIFLSRLDFESADDGEVSIDINDKYSIGLTEKAELPYWRISSVLEKK